MRLRWVGNADALSVPKDTARISEIGRLKTKSIEWNVSAAAVTDFVQGAVIRCLPRIIPMSCAKDAERQKGKGKNVSEGKRV